MDCALDANRAAVQTPPLCSAAVQRDARYMVENTALNEADALARRHPIAAFSLDALTAGAAKLRPDRIALAAVPGQPAREISYGEFDRQVQEALAQHIGELGLARGE